ncbi:MAG: DUF4178 domain-containing protein [Euzebya sp.]
MIWLLVLIVVLVVVVIVILSRRGGSPAARSQDPFLAAAPPQAAEALDLAPGSVITYDGRDWTVRGSLSMNTGGATWSEHLLDDTTTKRWLSVEVDTDVELAWWTTRPLGAVSQGSAGDRAVTVDDVQYLLDERGTAQFSATGTTGTTPSGTYTYADYVADGGALASFERFGDGAWEVGVGHPIALHEVTIYPTGRP